MPKKDLFKKRLTDEQIEQEYNAKMETDYFRKAPQALQRVVYTRLIAGIAFIIAGVVSVFLKFAASMIIPPFIIGFVAILSSINIRNVATNGSYKTFKGTVVDYEYTTPLKTKIKAVIFACDNKRYKISYPTKKIKIGDFVAVYSPSTVLVYERNGYHIINEYYGVDIERASYSA